MLNHRIVLTVPSTNNVNVADTAAGLEWTDRVKKAFATWFGGVTVIPAEGGWMSPDKGYVPEKVWLVQSFTDAAGVRLRWEQVKGLASVLAEEMGQECVALQCDDCLHFITAEAEADTAA